MELRYTPVVDLPGVEAFRALGFRVDRRSFFPRVLYVQSERTSGRERNEND